MGGTPPAAYESSMVSRTKTAARRGPADLISDRSHRYFRRVFDEIFSLSGEGRMTLDVLKEISATLLRFFVGPMAAYHERKSAFKALMARGEPNAADGRLSTA